MLCVHYEQSLQKPDNFTLFAIAMPAKAFERCDVVLVSSIKCECQSGTIKKKENVKMPNSTRNTTVGKKRDWNNYDMRGNDRDREKERNSMTIQLPLQQGAQRTRHEFIDTQPEDKEKKAIWILFLLQLQPSTTHLSWTFFFLSLFTAPVSDLAAQSVTAEQTHKRQFYLFYSTFQLNFLNGAHISLLPAVVLSLDKVMFMLYLCNLADAR